MINGRVKGKVAEREVVAKLVDEFGLTARRTQQYMGAVDASDVQCKELDAIGFEVKKREQCKLADWIERQRQDDPSRIPAVWFRRNREPWIVAMSYKDWVLMALKAYGKTSTLSERGDGLCEAPKKPQAQEGKEDAPIEKVET